MSVGFIIISTMMIWSSDFYTETNSNSDRFITLWYENTCKEIAQSLHMLLQNDEIWENFPQ